MHHKQIVMSKTVPTTIIKSTSPAMERLVNDLKERKAAQVKALRTQLLCAKGEA